MNTNQQPVCLALVHYPVYDRAGSITSSSVTNLDIHDFARLARTYDLAGVFLVSPVPDQQRLVERILNHWQHGHGSDWNEHRAAALQLVEIANDLEEAAGRMEAAFGQTPLWLATSARFEQGEGLTPERVRSLAGQQPLLIIFGTANGLARSVLAACDERIAAIRAGSSYNHLSVREAAAILVDRIFGR